MRRHTILLVDDEESVLHALVRLLRPEPYDLLTATNGRQAVDMIAQRPIDLVLTDYRMPEMNGVELLREIRPRYPDAMRIVLSGYANVDTMLNAVSVGEVYRFVVKPWANDELRQVIRQALEYYDLLQDNRLLLRVVRQQADVLQRIATEHPEVIKVPLTADGVCALSGEEASILRELMKRYAQRQGEAS